jgi:DNA ligase-1
MRPFEPMLAGKFEDIPLSEQLTKLKYPLAMQPKYDGVRVVCHHERGVVKRKLEPVDNLHIRGALTPYCQARLDGEVIVVSDDGKACKFQESQSGVARFDGQPQFKMVVFDTFMFPTAGFFQRYVALKKWFEKVSSGNLQLAPTKVVSTPGQVLGFYEECLAEGHEGAMIRSLDGLYKYGRSTLNEGYLIKMKPFEDAEAIILGFEELQHNTNEDVKNAMGRAKRGHSKAGMVGASTLGKFLVRGVGGQFDAVEFAIGTGKGLTRQLRDTIWSNREAYLGRIVTYEYQVVGIKDKPRCPIFKGFRKD